MAQQYHGVEVSYSDGRDKIPIQAASVSAEKGHAWLTKEYDGEWPLRILACQVAGSSSRMPFSDDVVSVASPGDAAEYSALSDTEGGGSSGAVGYPTTIIAKTPEDGGPFCSFAITTTSWRKGIVCGIYQYDDPVFDCAECIKGSRLYSGWRSDGWHVMVVPAAFLLAHAKQKAREIAQLNHKVAALEAVVTQPRDPDDDLLDFGVMTQKLHDCSIEVIRLDRRAHFETGLIRNLESMLDVADPAKKFAGFELIRNPVGLAKNMIQSQEYDLEALPKRIESQRTLIFNLVIQRDSRLNLQIGRTNMEIAETSRRIAETTMRDGASMQTIAILTMVFLPGTAVASFFSMTMFDWAPAPGDGLASSYVWVYFVTSVPLTALVLVVWWFTLRRRRAAREIRIMSDLGKMMPRMVT